MPPSESAIPAPATPAPPWLARILLALSDIKLAHSVFALPFAVLGAFLAAHAGAVPAPRFAGQLALILLCMFFARTWAMLVNRLADWRFDRDNPRTARRVIASGRLSPREGWLVALACASCFMICCTLFWFLFANPWPTILGLPVLAWIALYSYTKRFTFLCHLFLGGALAASPIAAAIAVAPQTIFDPESLQSAIYLISGFVLFWVAGFDVAYALADIDFDRRTGLHSIPARLGPRGALWVARLLHLCAYACLLLAWLAAAPFGTLTLGAIGAVGGVLIAEHIVLARRGVAGLPLAFFTFNGAVSLLLGAAGVVDVLI